jgi:hypothetical protein
MAAVTNKLHVNYALLLSIGGGKSIGTGFRIKIEEDVYLVTARHVIFNEAILYGEDLIVTSYAIDDLEPEPVMFNLKLAPEDIFDDEKNDCVLIRFGRITQSKKTGKKEIKIHQNVNVINRGLSKGRSFPTTHIRRLSETRVGSDVFLIGYPTSLGMLSNNYYDFKRPLLRKGSLAGLDAQRGTFVIDCPSYPGNSGGPVLEYCNDGKYRVIGLVSRYIPFETKWFSSRERIQNTELSNSGYTVCIAMDKVLNLIK